MANWSRLLITGSAISPHLLSSIKARHWIVKWRGYFSQGPRPGISRVLSLALLMSRQKKSSIFSQHCTETFSHSARTWRGKVRLMRSALPSPSCNSQLRGQWNFIGPCCVIPGSLNVIGNQRVPFKLSLYYSKQLDGGFLYRLLVSNRLKMWAIYCGKPIKFLYDGAR